MKQTQYDQSVTGLQTMLRTVARLSEAQPTVVPDGVFGEQTAFAVREFQRQHGIQESGNADFETWEALTQAYHEACVEVDAAAPLEIELDCRQAILPGSKNRHIPLIQGMLVGLSACYPELSDVRVSGIYDDTTRRAVCWLQKCCGLSDSGVFTKKTWQLLTGLYRAKIGNGEAEKGLQP